LPIIQQICSAVQYAHNHNVIHGNIKPSNIFLAADGHMLLSDFGIARSYDDSQQSLTRVGWGSAEYAAPEQSLGVLRRASDVYALGVLLFRILTGQPPFTGLTPVEVLLKHVRQPAPLARSLVPSISNAVDAVLQAAMQKRSDDRLASPEELSNAFFMAVRVAPVASPVAKSMLVPASRPLFEYSQLANNPHTPLPALTPAFPSGELQTPPPTPFALLTRPLTQPLALPQASMDVNHSDIGADSTEKSSADFLQDDIREDKHFFWSVDPVEWSPSVQVYSVPPTANDYLQSKPAVEEAMATQPETPPVNPRQPYQKQDEQVEPSRSARINEVLDKLLPIIVVILLLIGLLGALLSSFFYPSNGHGAYMLPHGTQYVVVQTRYKEGSNG
jgi:serine/threonine protein kinase